VREGVGVAEGLEGLSTGERIRTLRRQAGMSRAVLGGLVGRSAEWVKAVENGRLQTPRLSMLLSLARALGIADLAELTGNGVAVPVESFTNEAHSALGAVRAALTDYRLVQTDVQPVSSRHLAVRLEQAWAIRHSTPDHRTAVGSVLPALIRDAQHAVKSASGEERRAARKVLAGVYQLADFYVAYQPAPELVWLVTDRALTEAQEADDPYLIAGGAWALTQALRDAGRWDEAIAVSEDGARQLEPHLEGDNAPADWRGMWGALTFETGYVHARRGKYGQAWSYWDRANQVADRLGPGYRHTQSSFSQAVMNAHGVTLDVELRRFGDAVQRANRFEAASIPSIARRSRHLVEVARAHFQQNDHTATYAQLLAAANTAPETVRFNSYAREMAMAMVAKPPTGMADEVRRLASDVGIAV
jgi:transcriptional regulator with XRE-family HTH domain